MVHVYDMVCLLLLCLESELKRMMPLSSCEQMNGQMFININRDVL